MNFCNTFNLLLEKLGEYAKFSQLPDKMPYGFVVHPDASMDDIMGMGGHEDMVLSHGYRDLDQFLRHCGVHVAYNAEDKTVYMLADLTSTKCRKALKTAKDIARWYNKRYKVESAYV